MTRKSKARFGMSRTYKLNPAVKALRNALFAGITMAAIAPGAQAACIEISNTVICTGIFNDTLDSFDELSVSMPFDPAIIILDAGTEIDVVGGSGVDAFNNNDLSLVSYANINAISNLDVAGIRAVSQFGDTSVSNSGAITVESVNGNAFGIYSSSTTGDIVVDNTDTGSITTNATNGLAAGIVAGTPYGAIDISNSGDISVAGGYGATGIYTYNVYGDTSVTSTGIISAETRVGAAKGIAVYAIFSDATVSSAGDITVQTGQGSAIGIDVANYYAAGVTVSNSGDISAASTVSGLARGIEATAYYDVSISNTGDVSASTVAGGSAQALRGISRYGYSSISNDGALSASSLNSNAIGIVSVGFYGASVSNSGDISAQSNLGFVAGMYLYSRFGEAYISNSGDISAASTYGLAYGVTAIGGYGVEVNSSGDITVASTYNQAYGINTYAYSGDSIISSEGNVSASAYYDATGLRAKALYGVASINSSGDVSVSSQNGIAYGLYATAYGSNADISNTGDISAYSYGGAASAMVALALDDVTLINTGNLNVSSVYGDAIGMVALTTNGTASITNSGAITAESVNGNAFGIYGRSMTGDIVVNNSSTGTITIDSTNRAAVGVFASTQYGAIAVSNGGDISASSIDALAIGIYGFSYYGGVSISNSGDISATGSDAWAIVSVAEATSITNASSGKIFGAIYTADGSGDDLLTNNGTWYAGDINVSQFGDGDDSIVNNSTGKIYMDDSIIDMGGGSNSFLNDGKLYANGANNIIDISYTGSGVFTNNGSSIHMEDGDVDDALTIFGDFAGTGHIVVDASSVSMLADRLYIEGDVTTNTANIIDVFMATSPSTGSLLAGDTIDVVTVSGTSTATNFNIGTVEFAVDSLYSVGTTLIKDINVSGTTDQFSLAFNLEGLSTAGTVASSISPAVQSLWNLGTGTLFQREGTKREFKQNASGSAVAEHKGAAGVWARYYFGDGSVTPDTSSNNFGVTATSNNFDMDASGWEVGAGYAFNSQWAAGVLGGTSSSTVKPDVGGRTKIDGTTWGAYVTYTPGNGFYADLSYRAMDFDGNGEGGQTTFGYEGSANGFNLELGYGYKTTSGLIIEPQLQLSSVSVDLDTINYQLSDFRLSDGDSTLLRVGAALRKNYRTSKGYSWTPYGALSYLDETSGSNSYLIDGLLEGDVDTSGASALLEVGATAFVERWGISAGLNWRDGSAYDSVLGGQLSVRYDW